MKNKKETELVKEGKHVDLSDKIERGVKFGMSKGATLNMGNFESLRVDVWMSDEPQEGENLAEAFERVSEILEEELTKVVDSYKE